MPKSYKHFHFESIDSTNDVCLKECKKNNCPVVVTADLQNKGRGRNQKKWSSPAGSISYSFGYKSKHIDPSVCVKAGLIVAKALEKVFDLHVSLKWPNDLIFRNKKVGGILVESENVDSDFCVVIGIGINLNIVPKEDHWGNLNIGENEKFIKKTLIQEFSNRLIGLENMNTSEWQKDWLARCIHLNKEVILINEKKSFIFSGIDSEGKMLLKDESNSIKSFNESSISVKGLY